MRANLRAGSYRGITAYVEAGHQSHVGAYQNIITDITYHFLITFFQNRCISKHKTIFDGNIIADAGIRGNSTTTAEGGSVTNDHIIPYFTVSGKTTAFAYAGPLLDNAKIPDDGIIAYHCTILNDAVVSYLYILSDLRIG
jgi:hypothetical protein